MSKDFIQKIKGTSDLQDIISELKKFDSIEYSTSLVERISVGGDVTGSPFYHWRWKEQCIPDIVIWPKNQEEIINVLKLANKFRIPVYPRGGGSNYFGSSSPTKKGIVLDLKQLSGFKINMEKKLITIKAGTSFQKIISHLKKAEYELGCYPTNALAASIGGWLCSKAKIGIGTFKHGSIIDQIKQMTVISPKGEVKILKKRREIKTYFESYGIFGIIVDVILKIFPAKRKIPLFFGFSEFENLTKYVDFIKKLEGVFFISFSDQNFEQRIGGVNRYPFYLFIVLSSSEENVPEEKKTLIKEGENLRGEYLGESKSLEKWENILKEEIMIKKDVPVLMLQSYLINLRDIETTIKCFKQIIEERKLNYAFHGYVNKDLQTRLLVFTPTNNEMIVHFLSSKGALHKLTKFIYNNNLGSVYNYGLYNSIYLEHFEKEKFAKLKDRKEKVDPHDILNPLRLIETKTSFRRINLIFELNLFWRKLAVKLGIQQNMNLEANEKNSEK